MARATSGLPRQASTPRPAAGVARPRRSRPKRGADVVAAVTLAVPRPAAPQPVARPRVVLLRVALPRVVLPRADRRLEDRVVAAGAVDKLPRLHVREPLPLLRREISVRF